MTAAFPDFEAIRGQERAVALLRSSVTCDRVHHAWIFHGPVGVGKFTTALAFARLLLCHAPGGEPPAACGACESCRLLEGPDRAAQQDPEARPDPAASAHPDLHVVNKELARYSEDKTIRDRKLTRLPLSVLKAWLIEPASQSSRLGRGRLFIVDEAELMAEETQNALLKTLEEPPAGTRIVLVTSHEDRLLPTIRSRAQRVGFGPLPETVVAEAAARLLPEAGERERAWAVEFAAGSLGALERVAEYELITWARRVLPALEGMRRGEFDPGLGEAMRAEVETLAKTWVERHDGASKVAANHLGAGLLLQLITRRAQKRLHEIAREGGDAGPWLEAIEVCARTEQELAANAHLGLACHHLAAGLAGALG